MSTTPTTFEAGAPRISGPIRRIARPLGPLARPIAGKRWFPFYAVLHHAGRTSGTAYATPVVALRTPDGFIVPLPVWRRDAVGEEPVCRRRRIDPLGRT